MILFLYDWLRRKAWIHTYFGDAVSCPVKPSKEPMVGLQDQNVSSSRAQNSKELWGVLNFWSVVVLLRVEILGRELMSEIFRGLEAARNFLSSKFRERFRPNAKEADQDDRWRYAIRELCIRFLVFHRTSAEGLHPSWPVEGRLGSLMGVLLGVGHLEGCTLHLYIYQLLFRMIQIMPHQGSPSSGCASKQLVVSRKLIDTLL